MTGFEPAERLRQHRPLLLALEAIGWLHMTGKARIDFLREHGGQKDNYDYKNWHEQENPPFPWDNLLQWVKGKSGLGNNAWPGTFADFFSKHPGRDGGMLGLLQAGHAMASGIEKQSFSQRAVEYLGQDVTHMWLSTAFGHPVRNLLDDPPELLTDAGWKGLLEQIKQLLTELQQLGDNGSQNDIDGWWSWRDGAVGPEGWLRKAFTATLAETRLPNNDVTLFDQSYVAAALFKSATAGAIMEGGSFPWSSKGLKQQTRWRLLTIGVGADHYEARAVKIGDWTGAHLALDEFFTRVCKLVEVDLAVGSLLYRDGETCVFSFPGERFGHDKQGYQGGDLQISGWQSWLSEQMDGYARDANLEMPPYCHISKPSRSLVGMTAEIRKARETVIVPLHRNWQIPGQDVSDGHVCPVCLVRRTRSGTDKQMPCDPCKARRTHRLDMWLEGRFGSDSIWISEVSDANDRVALVTMSLDIEPWLDGTRLDALRTQAIPEWRKFNPVLKNQPNPIDPSTCFGSLFQHIKGKLQSFDKADPVLSNLQEGYQHETDWPSFFSKIVEDRTDSPQWDAIGESGRAGWLTHQLLRKLASPGRIYRFERQAEDFFKALLAEFREIAAADQNRWRVRRLVIKPENGSSGSWQDRQTYGGRYGDAPISLLYREQTKDFLAICNLARLLKPEQDKNSLNGITLELKADDSVRAKQLVVQSATDDAGALGVYRPVIPLDLSPVRFRVLLPLETVSGCVDRAIEAWRDQFAHVWDRLPLRVGVVAFPRMTPFQAVIDTARTIEDDMDRIKKSETWPVAGYETREGVAALSLKSLDHRHELLQTIPTRLPDGRDDVFYPYLVVEDKQVRFPLDFQHPDGRVFRHAKDLRSGDGVLVYPSLIATIFMDGTARRFEPLSRRQFTEWLRMRDLWRLLDRHGQSQTALRGAWSELVGRRDAWQKPDGTWFEGGKTAWLDLARAVFCERLGVRGACLETLVQAASDGLLDWCLEWHVSVLKKQVTGGDR
ncbi:MAG: CRISPR-associated protein Csx11 [Thermodesulfobacteriota bacterium]|nr:CRISPR-associated protein Csx11 [Thermodesulfobacteriota bacterium]